MKMSAVLAVTLAFAGNALADVNYDLGKQQARRAVSQSDAQAATARRTASAADRPCARRHAAKHRRPPRGLGRDQSGGGRAGPGLTSALR